MMRDSHTPIQVDIPGPKCLPPGLSLKKQIFGSNIGYEVRAVSHFLMVYCKKKNLLFFLMAPCYQSFFFTLVLHFGVVRNTEHESQSQLRALLRM